MFLVVLLDIFYNVEWTEYRKMNEVLWAKLYSRRQTCQAREGIFVNLHIDFSLFVVNPAFMRVLSTNFEVNSDI